jgi:hypothetical protein
MLRSWGIRRESATHRHSGREDAGAPACETASSRRRRRAVSPPARGVGTACGRAREGWARGGETLAPVYRGVFQLFRCGFFDGPKQ